MASPKRRQGSHDPDLILQSDFKLLSDFVELVGSHPSQQLKPVAWEIMRRYTSHLGASAKPEPKDYYATLGDARWGDAKRVESIFGIKRGVLLRLADEGVVKSCSLESERTDEVVGQSTRAKRLYCLVSIAEYFESCAANQNRNATWE